MTNTIDACLTDWRLNRVLTVTLDNASSNDLGIKQLKKRIMSCNNLVFNGEYMHMRCCAHILNIIVSEGLSDLDMSILRLRATVKYVRSSPRRFAKFKAFVERSNSEYKGLVCLDVETRWNSIYLMLDSALKHRKAFEVLEIHDPKYSEELLKGKGKGVPTSFDWAKAQPIMPFLKMFYDATLRISGSSYVASNMYMLEVFGIGEKILKMCNSKDMCLKVMADRMKTKYDKYWGKFENLNMLLISSILDPRNKLKFVNWLITQNFNSFDATKLKDLLKTCLDELIIEYNGVGEGFQSESQIS
ncbi:zinc finger BED domain-containing protein RICESLEEPER 2-like [Cicer arietinum]|uniref:Zinc finger BED domain-containing protein RICESLEEPER 2-like n=1 Tax=Cicer arietinum TaxID=3827 RepID=A0A1S3DZV6_CICAR|nr:zinc finger BED domain-containing protein RICESLEEPER 2-like [Cicer arietinum]